jgi:hypothetical protein
MSTRWRATHALIVGAMSGMGAFLEAHHLDGAILLGAAVAGLSGGAGAVIRQRAGAPEIDDVMARLAGLESDMHELRSLVTALLGNVELLTQRGQPP